MLEFSRLNDVDEILLTIDENSIKIDNLFIFTDDYSYVEQVSRKRPMWNIYTLTNKSESGYENAAFNKMCWKEKRKSMIKLFSMVEICLASDLHLGNEQTCVNNYIKSVKPKEKYFCIMSENDAILK